MKEVRILICLITEQLSHPISHQIEHEVVLLLIAENLTLITAQKELIEMLLKGVTIQTQFNYSLQN